MGGRAGTGTIIHASAVVAASAELGDEVEIGPYVVVGDGVRIGDRTRIASHVVIEGPTELGADNRVFPFASIGQGPQDLKFRGESTRLVVGDRNQIREYVTLHRGTDGGGGITRVGDDNLLMVGAHVAHDCQVGNGVIMANQATLAGHVVVEDGATVGAFSAIHQFCRVGRHAFVGGGSIVVKDALPFARSQGNHAKCYGENAIGLRRKGFDDVSVRWLHRAFRLLLSAGMNTTQALDAIRADAEMAADPHVAYLVEFIETAQRGVTK